MFSAPNSTLNFGDVRYIPMANVGNTAWASTESVVNIDAPVAMTVDKVRVEVYGNTLNTGNTTVKSRKNSAYGNISISIAHGTTGSFEDLTNSDSISAGDDCCWEISVGGSSGTINLSYIGWVQDLSTLYNFYCTYISTAISADRYLPLVGGNGSGTATESSTQWKAKTTGTFEKAYAIVEANSTTSTVNIRLRKNSANGNIAIAVSAGSTGRFSDTSNTDSVAVDDLFNIVKNGGNSATFSARIILTFTPSDLKTPLICGGDATNSGTVAKSSTVYAAPSGRILHVNQADDAYAKMSLKVQLSYLSAYLSNNAVGGGASTLYLWKNGAAGNQSVSIASLTSGWFHDTSNTDDMDVGDAFCYKLVTNTSGTNMRPTQYQIQVQDISGTAYTKDLGEVVTLVANVTKTPSRSFSEVATFVASLAKNAGKNINETATFVDTFVSQKTLGRSLLEAVTFVDSFIKIVGRSFSEAVTFVDSVLASSVLYRSFDEAVTFTDSLLHMTGKSFVEAVSFADSLSKDIARSLSESAVFVDSVFRTIGRPLQEAATFTDTLARAIGKSMTETMEFADSLSKSLSRALSESATFVDGVTHAIGRSFVEAVTFVDTFAKTLIKNLGESVSFTAKWLVLLNGITSGLWARTSRITSLWDKIVRTTSSWTKEERSEDSWTKIDRQ